MSIVEATSKQGTAGVRKLREQKLANGLPFMISAKELDDNQFYLEYPDGVIKLASVTHMHRDINIIRELSEAETELLRNRFQLTKAQ